MLHDVINNNVTLLRNHIEPKTQFLIMIFSLIGLSTTVLMVAEAFMMATPGLNPIWGYLIVIGPVAVFAGLCRLYKNGDTQLKMAAVCSLLYRNWSELAILCIL